MFLLFFYGLTTTGLLSADEPRYASIGREMAVSGDWITPRLWGEPWFEKPPLLYWLVALGFKAGLGDDLRAEAPDRDPQRRISPAVLSSGTEGVRRACRAVCSGILATSAGWLAYSHVAVTDIPLAATFSAALLLCLPWVRSGGRRGLLIAGVFLGLAVLAKGLVPLVLMAPLLWIAGRRWPDLFISRAPRSPSRLPGMSLCYWQNGNAFIDEFFWKHHVSRFFSPELQHVQPWWYYVPVLLGLLFPWTPTLAVIPHRTSDNRRKLLLAVVVFGFVLFSAATNKLPAICCRFCLRSLRWSGFGSRRSKDVRALSLSSAALLLLTYRSLPAPFRRRLPGAVDVPIVAVGLGGRGSDHRGHRDAFSGSCARAPQHAPSRPPS